MKIRYGEPPRDHALGCYDPYKDEIVLDPKLYRKMLLPWVLGHEFVHKLIDTLIPFSDNERSSGPEYFGADEQIYFEPRYVVRTILNRVLDRVDYLVRTGDNYPVPVRW